MIMPSLLAPSKASKILEVVLVANQTELRWNFNFVNARSTQMFMNQIIKQQISYSWIFPCFHFETATPIIMLSEINKHYFCFPYHLEINLPNDGRCGSL